MATHSRILAWRIPWTEEPEATAWSSSLLPLLPGLAGHSQYLTGTGLVLLQICCPRSLRGAMAPTATSALPSSESQRANITGKARPSQPPEE